MAIFLADCIVSDWSDWTQCRHPQTRPAKSSSFAGELFGEGARARLWGMSKKLETRQEKHACVEKGECPVYSSVMGNRPCTGGKVKAKIEDLFKKSYLS